MKAVTRHVLANRLRGRNRCALVLMLEPLFRCNLACSGCGKIQHPAEVMRRQLTAQQCFDAADQCGAPIVSIAGGEPLLHPDIDQIVAGLIAQRKFIYLCTNGLLLEESLGRFSPSRHLVLSVHLDGQRELHDQITGRMGVYDTAVSAIREAVRRGYRVTTNTTLFADAQPDDVRAHLTQISHLGVEGMTLSPGFAYAAAPDQAGFLQREKVERLFCQVLAPPRRGWRLNQTPLFLLFLQGKYKLDCTPWGTPTYNVFGWQKPCYLLDEAYCGSFRELLDTTDWSLHGPQSGQPSCEHCMVHCGYEPTAVHATLGTWNGLINTLRWWLWPDRKTMGGEVPDHVVTLGHQQPAE